MVTAETAEIVLPTSSFDENILSKGIFLCLLHMKRVPPHIGLIINGKYHSLTIKGPEPNVAAGALLKTINQKKIESLFIKIKDHPVFSIDHLNDSFLEILKKHTAIKSNESTCLTPIKQFFEEFYAVEQNKDEIIYTFLNRLNNNAFILMAYSLNLEIENGVIEVPVYSQEDLDSTIKNIRSEFYKD